MNAIILKTEICKHGFRHLIRCNLSGCKGTKWVPDSDIKSGKGKYCSNMCRLAALSLGRNKGKRYNKNIEVKSKEYNSSDFAEFVRVMTKWGY